MIETLSLYCTIEYAEQKVGDMGNYLLSGTMLRVALQEGYHRDPSQHPNLTVFQGEMRRRVWSAVSQHDLLFSVHVSYFIQTFLILSLGEDVNFKHHLHCLCVKKSVFHCI
jgi:hypothetical protein